MLWDSTGEPDIGSPISFATRCCDRAEQRQIAEQLLEEGLTPLDIMKARMAAHGQDH
jgi:hypothetical protein